jgi:hypothetical protein
VLLALAAHLQLLVAQAHQGRLSKLTSLTSEASRSHRIQCLGDSRVPPQRLATRWVNSKLSEALRNRRL